SLSWTPLCKSPTARRSRTTERSESVSEEAEESPCYPELPDAPVSHFPFGYVLKPSRKQVTL
ncbi:hypothetical protein F3H74_28235, partial [Klebsiella pneumoniae]|nr:hypothetical protein [Klebsiella pneumoniae]